MMEDEMLIKKKNRAKKLEKRRFAKTSGTLAGQISRTRTARGYHGKTAKAAVQIKIPKLK